MKIEDVYALSPLQQGLYYHWLRSPEAYFEQTTYQLKGEFDSSILEKTYQLLVERHAILRTVFTTNFGEKVLQVVRKEGGPSFQYTDVSADTEFSLDDFNLADRAAGFDLNKGPLMRLTVLFHGNDTYSYIWSHHHILMDGWCMSILIKEFFQLYHYLLHNEKPVLPKVYPYSAYIKWLEQVDEKKAVQYWTEYLADYHSISSLQTDIPVQRESYEARESFLVIEEPLRQRIKNLCESAGVTENILVQALWGILLSKYNNTADVVFGSVVSGRPAEITGIEQMIGLFINTIPIRVQVPAGMLFSNLLLTMQQASVESSRHHYTQLAAIQAASEPGNQLFDHILVFENYPVQDMMAQGMETSSGKMPIELLSMESYEQSNYNFSLAIVSGQEMSFRFTYNGNAYTSAYIQRLSKHFRSLLEQVTDCPETPVAQLDFLSGTEREKLLAWGSGLTAGEQSWVNQTVIPLFDSQVRSTPDAIAVEFENVQLTYRELDALSNRFAAFLVTEFGVGANDLVAIQLPRSEWILVSILAVWKSGGAYVPIDLQYPQERVNYILQDSQCKVQIDAAALTRFCKESHQYAATVLSVCGNAKDIAYVIYTSGSTGKPKGVQVTQESLVSFAVSSQLTFGSKHPVVMPLLASYAFDIFLFETLLPLLSGGMAMMISEEQIKDIPYLAAQLKKANAFHAVPAFMSQIIQYIQERDPQDYKGIRDLFVGGDAVPSNVLTDMRTVCPQADIHVLYGPTESTIFVTACHYPHHGPAQFKGSAIGRPNHNALIYITDAYGALAPEGTVGEICIGGPGVASGYLHQPALNAEKFVSDPFLQGSTMYRTGDLGRWLPDGNLAFAGRMDGQVKIRGYRIELGEIASVMQNYPGIDESAIVVQVQETGDKALVAFTVSKTLLSAEDLRAYLGTVLPAFMIPEQFVPLKQLPLTPNGKVDKKALQQYHTGGINNSAPYLPPRNVTEEKLILIWQAILGKERIGIHDDFFALGGHSLKITRLSSQLRKELDVQVSIKSLFAASRLEDQALLIQQSKRAARVMIMPAAEQESYPLSSSQRRIWLMGQFYHGNAAYNMPAMYILEGTYDHMNLEYAFKALLQRHEILRTAFKEDTGGEVRQFILPTGAQDFRISFMDLRGREQQEENLRDLLQSEFLKPFDLTKYTLLRAGIFQLANHKWAFVLVMHHIISDGWSMGILINELFALYHARKANLTAPLSPLSIQYKDYAVWQQEQLLTGGVQTQQTYWLNQLSGELPVLEMPLDKPRPAIRTYNGGAVKTVFNTALLAQLKTLNQQQGTTLFMGLLSLVSVLLYRYTNQGDMIIGSPIAGREHSNLEDQIGFYLNTLPLRIPVNEGDSYHILLEKIKKITLDAYEHQAYPFDELVDSLVKKQDQSRNPLFDVMVVLQNAEGHAVHNDQLSELKISAYDLSGNPSSKFDLLFEFVEAADTIQVNIEYNSDIFKHASIVRLSHHLEQLLTAVLAKPSEPIGAIDYLTGQEKEILLLSFNDTEVDYPGSATVATAFEAQVNQTPDNTALIFETVSLTYLELNAKANQLAHFLTSQHDIQPDDLVGIALNRSEWLMIAILAVFKSGGGYVPLEPSYPKQRIDYMIADSNCKFVINETLLAQFLTVGSEYPTDNPVTAATAGHLAYVMYTSGSTGTPKGVMVEHQNVIRLVKSANFITLTGKEVLLSTGAVSFDATTFEYWSMLLNGGTLVVCDKDTLLDTQLLRACIETKKVDTMWFTAGWFNQLADKDIAVFKGLKTILVGGDKLSVIHVQAVRKEYPLLQLINGYGPTENTTFSLTYAIPAVFEMIPVGKPISNSTAYVLDPQGLLCPVGVAGEICVGGAGLARGYLNNPELTAEKFVSSQFLHGQRLYKTGDLGRWLPDGNIEFIGRKDAQVKIRGYRIELGEVEKALQHHPDISAAVVTAKTTVTGEKELAGYVVSKLDLNVSVLTTYLSGILPAYMVPAHFIQLDVMPLTPNGKVDIRQLPGPEDLQMETGTAYVAARNATEEKLIEIWQEILGRETIGIRDNFFELGGQSIKAARLAGRIRQVFDIRFSLVLLFDHPTVEDIAAEIEKIYWANKEVLETEDGDHFSI